MTKNLTIIRHAQSIWNANLHKSEQDAVRKNYIKCDILIVSSLVERTSLLRQAYFP